MTSIGFNAPLYLLPFDQRILFQKRIFPWADSPIPNQNAQIAAAKMLIYDGFKAAVATGVPQARGGIIVDEQFGAAILRDAVARGYLTGCAAEKTGYREFDFEYGREFRQHIEAFGPAFCKVQVRYNPEGNETSNRRQSARLRRLSDYLHGKDSPLLAFELLVPPEKTQLDSVRGNETAYEVELRPRLIVQAIEELQMAQIEPDVWQVEGFDRRVDCEKVVAAARRGGRKKVGCVVLGRGADEAKIRRWLTVASTVRGFIGFAVGQANFLDPLVAWGQKTISREEAVAAIARRYRRCVDVFEGKLCAAA